MFHDYRTFHAYNTEAPEASSRTQRYVLLLRFSAGKISSKKCTFLYIYYILNIYFCNRFVIPVSKKACLLLIFKELETGIVDLLIPSPNATAEVGYNRDR